MGLNIPNWATESPGYGYGCGYGCGCGYGDGANSKQYFSAILAEHESNHTGCTLGFWRSDKDGKPFNGGTGQSRKTGQVEEISGPLKICTKNALHATLNPSQWKGDRWWVVALYEPIQRDGDKLGSLKRKIVADLGKCPF